MSSECLLDILARCPPERIGRGIELSEHLSVTVRQVSSPICVQGVSGSSQLGEGVTIRMKLGDNGESIVEHFLVFPNLPERVLLGAKFMRERGAVLNFVENTFSTTYPPSKVQFDCAVAQKAALPQQTVLYATTAFSLPPQSHIRVPVAAISGVTPIVDAERFNTSVNVKCLERYHRHDPAKFSAASIDPPLSPAPPTAVVRPISFFGDHYPELASAVRGPSLDELFAPPGSRHRAQFQVIGAAASAPVPGSKRKKSSALPPEPILDRPLEQAPAHLRAPTNRFPARARRSTPLYQDGLLRGFFANVVDLS